MLIKTHKRMPFKSVSRRLSNALIGTVTLTLVLFASIVIYVNVSGLYSELQRRFDATLGLAQTTLVEPLWNFDQATTDSFVDALLLDPQVTYVAVLDDDSKLVSLRTRPEHENKAFSYFEADARFLVGTTTIVHDQAVVGRIQIAMSYQAVRDELLKNVSWIVVLTVLVIGVISLTTLLVTRRYIASPLLGLQGSAARIAKGDLETPIDPGRLDEIGRLADHLAMMRDSLKRSFRNVRESNHKLEDANRTLEQKVVSRTREIAQAMDEAQTALEVAREASRAKSDPV